MTGAQTWTLIGVVIGLLTFVAAMVNAQLTSFRNEINGRFDGLQGEFSGLRNEFGGLRNEVTTEIRTLREVMETRFDATNQRIDMLDRDVQNVIGKLFREGG
jgi:hypothetical protein